MIAPEQRHTFWFLGGDTAPSDNYKSDDGALAVAGATPRTPPPPPGRGESWSYSDVPGDWFFDFMFARVFTAREKLSARQWSGYIHALHERFSFEKIVLDGGAGGGGVYVKRELMDPKQIINGSEKFVTPLCDQVDGPLRVVHGRFIVHMFKRGDPGIELIWPNPENSNRSLAGDELLKDALHSAYKEGLDHGIISYPGKVKDWESERRAEIQNWPDERLWALKCLDAATEQLKNILVATREDGTYQFTKRGAHIFNSLGRDDIALACMYCYAAFLIWLKSADMGQANDEDQATFGGQTRS